MAFRLFLWLIPFTLSRVRRRVDVAVDKDYGALGLAILPLGWLFILGRLMIASAVFNATLWARRQAAAAS